MWLQYSRYTVRVKKEISTDSGYNSVVIVFNGPPQMEEQHIQNVQQNQMQKQ